MARKKPKLNYGRQRIILDFKEVTPENFREVFELALPFFNKNSRDCSYLIDMFLGKQNILDRPAPNTSNINNTTVVNYAFPITREIVGYTFGNPFELVQKDQKNQEEVQKLGDYCNFKDIYAVDISTAIYSSICGLGYQITIPSPDIKKDNIPEVPLIIDTLDPRTTFVVQSTDVGNPQIMSCMVVSDSNNKIKKYVAFTDKYKFIYDSVKNELKTENNEIGLDPITMVENSLLLTGDWEQAIPVMDALNQITSDSLNDIEGAIRALLVLLGTELEDPSTTMQTIKDKRLLSLAQRAGTSGNLDAKFISPQVNSQEVQEVREFLDKARNIITGIPDRQANNVGGDTGVAVVNRNGWTDIEIVARLKELFFKKMKRKQVSVAIKILQKLDLIADHLRGIDVEINLGRNTLSDLSSKAAAFSTLVATGEIATIDALTFAGLTNRTNEVVERGKAAKKERMEEAAKLQNPQDTKKPVDDKKEEKSGNTES